MNKIIDHQGDIFIKQIEYFDVNKCVEIERDNQNRIVLAYGEVTGHAHAIKSKDAILFKEKNSERLFLVVLKPVELTHEEHASITYLPGKYEVRRQRQYTPEEIINVAD